MVKELTGLDMIKDKWYIDVQGPIRRIRDIDDPDVMRMEYVCNSGKRSRGGEGAPDRELRPMLKLDILLTLPEEI